MAQMKIDQARERAIDGHFRLMVSATTTEERRKHWAAMARLIQQRSPEQVARMERERGLH